MSERDMEIYRRLDVLMGDDGELRPDTQARINGHTVWTRPWMRGELIFEARDDYDALERMIEAGERSELPLAEPVPLRSSPGRACEYCDHSQFFFDGINIVATEPCPYPDGRPDFTIHIEVPSGRLMYADGIPGFGAEVGLSLNHPYGRAALTRAFEADGCAHFCVGNSCPGLWRDGDTFHVARFPVDDDTGEMAAPEGYEEIGSITTDLFWCTFVDAGEFERRGGEEAELYDALKVEPGTYRFTYQGFAKGFDFNAETARFASFEKLG